jgi:ferric-dicitrate binding protein FerR (iron transport regulator)
MTGGDFSGCFPRTLNRQTADVFGAARRKWSRRRLWGNGHGRFRTRGRHGTATVRGTHWLTEDRCDGTLIRVKRGLVEVRDLERRRTAMVGAGEQYFARSLEAKRLRSKSR